MKVRELKEALAHYSDDADVEIVLRNKRGGGTFVPQERHAAVEDVRKATASEMHPVEIIGHW